jgi:hypothetical protein
MPEIAQERLEELESHSTMLGLIGMYVEDFCEEEDDTTLVAVLRLLAKYHSIEAEILDHAVEFHKNRNE